VIRGNLELVLRNKTDGYPRVAEVQEPLVQTLEEAERLSKTVSQLMELTQLDSGEIQLEHDIFDLTELVATTADQMKLLAEDKQIQLEAQLSPQVKVQGDRYRLKQVLLNLIDNAIKYCPAGTRIQIRLAPADSSCVLEVRTTDPASPEERFKGSLIAFIGSIRRARVRSAEVVSDFPFANLSAKRTGGGSRLRVTLDEGAPSESRCHWPQVPH
jgi:K+-sensing histidine kinase KdpD